MKILARSLAAALLAAVLPSQAATVLEYDVEGECNTEFDRMVFDGLSARVDSTSGGYANTTIFDDSEQMMYFLSHESRTVMSIESDDDAVDFHGDVMRSTMIHAEKQTEKVTGVDMQALMAQAQASQVAMCPELAGMGFSDPDYADASMKCAEKMQKMGPADPEAQLAAAKAMAREMNGGGRGRRSGTAATPSAPPVQWTTTETTPTGETSEVAGVTCANETMRRGDVVLREQCMAAPESLPLDASAKRRLARMMKIGKGMSAGLAERMPGMADPDAAPTVALQRTCYADGRRTGAATLRVDPEAPSDESLFIVPQGYKPIGDDAPGG